MPRIRAWIPLSSILFALSVALGVTVTYSSLTTPRELRVDQGLQNLHEPWLTAAMQAISTLFSPPAGLVIIAVAAAVLWWRRQRLAAVSTFLTIAVGWNSTLILKLFVDRPRPPFVHDATASYPSGHVALATSCLYAAYFLVRSHPRREVRESIAVVGMFTVALVMTSRMYLGDHYLTDTIGAVLVSSAAIVCLTGFWPALRARLGRVTVFATDESLAGEPFTGASPAGASPDVAAAETSVEFVGASARRARTRAVAAVQMPAAVVPEVAPEPDVATARRAQPPVGARFNDRARSHEAARSHTAALSLPIRQSRADRRRAQTRAIPVPGHVGRHGGAPRVDDAPLSVQDILMRSADPRSAAVPAAAAPVQVAPPVYAEPEEPVYSTPEPATAHGEYRPPLGRWVRYDEY